MVSNKIFYKGLGKRHVLSFSKTGSNRKIVLCFECDLLSSTNGRKKKPKSYMYLPTSSACTTSSLIDCDSACKFVVELASNGESLASLESATRSLSAMVS